RPIERPRIDAFFAHFADAALRNCEIAQPLQCALEISIGVGRGYAAAALGRAHRDEEIDLRALNIRAIDPEQRLAGTNVLARPADEQILDEAIRSHGDHGQTRFIVHHCADVEHAPHDDYRLARSRAHAAALDFVETHLDGLAVVLLLVLIDRDVVHPHPV